MKMHRFPHWRPCLLTAMLLCLWLSAWSQNIPYSQLLGGYVEAKLQNRDTAPSLTRLNTLYKQMDANQQKAFLDSIYSGFRQQIAESKSTECQAFIDLYKFFASSDDEHLPEIYFTQGVLAAEVYRDSFALKESITDLLVCNQGRFPDIPDYLATLEDHLEKARNYRSLLQDIDGIWVCSSDLVDREYGMPYLVMKVGNNGNYIQLVGPSSPVVNWWLQADATTAAKIVDYGESAYVCWSSEKLKVTDEMWVQAAYDFGGSVSNLVADAFTGSSSSLGDVLRGNVAGGLVGMGFDMLFGSLFTPKKKMCIVECRLNRVNEVSMSAHARIQYITAVAGEQPKTETSEHDFMFYKYNPEWKVFFEGLYSYYPDKRIEKRKKELESMPIYYTRWMLYGNRRFFNFLQLNKIAYLATQELCEKQGTTQNDKRTTLGCILEDLSKHPDAEKNAKRGVYVKSISEYSYAFALKKGDVIQSVDGFEVSSPQDLNDLIASMKPFDIAHLQIMRGKKKQEVDVELYYYTIQ